MSEAGSKPEIHPLECASRALVRICDGIENKIPSASSSEIIGNEIAAAELTGGQAARAFDVVHGVLRWRYRLDAALNGASRRGKLEAPSQLRNLLRAAAYELLIRRADEPAGLVSAVVDIAKGYKGGKYGALANAVCRKLASAVSSAPPRDDAPLADFAAHYSIQPALLVHLGETRGREWAIAAARATADRFQSQLRVNPFIEPNEEFPASIGAKKRTYEGKDYWEADSLSPSLRKANAEGRIVVQALPSQYASFLLDPLPGDKVLDAASGVGTKAHHLLALMAGWGELVLADVSKSQRDKCIANFKRLGVPEPDYRILDLSDNEAVSNEFVGEKFDAILLDAPCTGSGLIHHMPEKRYTIDLGLLDAFADRQRKMLENLLRLLAPGGSLVYATCSVFKEEDEDVTETALETPVGRFTSVDRVLFPPCGRHIGFFVEKIRRLE
ncbi:MAG: RsmB/NOP family class I SAM-dependent RNA methyltransferase [bacterium]|jgi:16S rRNA (cytosine967-C5)-methyltransferase